MESLGDLVCAEHAVRQRRQRSFLEQLHQFAEQLGTDVPAVEHQLVEIDAEVSEISPERSQADMGVRDVVALAEFDEAAERTQAGDAALHRVAGEAVEDDVDAVAGDRPYVVDEIARARIENVGDVEAAEQVALRLRAGGGDDLRAARLCDLYRGHADRAGAAVNENPFTVFEPRLPGERVVGGEERDGDRRTGFDAERIGQFRGERRRHRDVGGEGRRSERATPGPRA